LGAEKIMLPRRSTWVFECNPLGRDRLLSRIIVGDPSAQPKVDFDGRLDHRENNAMAHSEQAQDLPSLYSRLGGVYSIATVVDDLIDRVMSDPRLNANPLVDEAHHRVPPAGFKYLVTELLCWAAGGPQSYSGRSMDESHRHLLITAGEWQAFMDDVQQTLDKFAVPGAEQAEVKALVESTRSAIVVG
jgi:hemoglobin